MKAHRPSLKHFVIARSVQSEMEAQKGGAPQRIPIIVCLKESDSHPELGVQESKEKVKEFLRDKSDKLSESDFYVFASLFPEDIQKLAELRQWVYQIWKDETTYGHLLSSVDTVKASSCWRTFDARGKGITWAVMDTGINAAHPHFATTEHRGQHSEQEFLELRHARRSRRPRHARGWHHCRHSPCLGRRQALPCRDLRGRTGRDSAGESNSRPVPPAWRLSPRS